MVVFGTIDHMNALLSNENSAMTAVGSSGHQLTFVAGSEEVGASDNVVVYQGAAQGMISVQLSESSSTSFDSWLTSKF